MLDVNFFDELRIGLATADDIRAWSHGEVKNPETIATAIRIGNPASWKFAEAARDDSQGWIDRVTDEQILEAQAILAAEAGVFIEPGSAASIAGLLKAAEEGKVPEGATIVCTVTGNGLKDTATALGGRDLDITPIAPTLEAARQFVPDQGHELLYEVHGVRLSDAVCKALLEQGLSAWG